MKVEWINPFIIATRETFAKMLHQQVTNGKPYLLTDEVNSKDISGVIGLSGTLRGAVVIGFPTASALATVEVFMGERFNELCPEVSDAVGELANIIAGYAKKDLPGEDIQIALPSVIRGEKHLIRMPKEVQTVVIPFEGPSGTFVLELGMKKVEG